MIGEVLNFATAIFLIIISSDLLYLYYMGAWYDPIEWVETSELIILYALVLFGVTQSFLCLKRILNEH